MIETKFDPGTAVHVLARGGEPRWKALGPLEIVGVRGTQGMKGTEPEIWYQVVRSDWGGKVESYEERFVFADQDVAIGRAKTLSDRFRGATLALKYASDGRMIEEEETI